MPIRLYSKDTLTFTEHIPLTKEEAHYLINVMRMKDGERFHMFNENDGEFLTALHIASKRDIFADVIEKLSPPEPNPDVWLLFAPVKRDAVDLIAAKSTELGVGDIYPVITARTIAPNINVERMQKIAIEASEQSRRINIPVIHHPQKLKEMLINWDTSRPLFFLDETGKGQKALAIIAEYKAKKNRAAFLIGPEGGFAPDELDLLRKSKNAIGLSLDKHILKTETACMAALVLWTYS